MNIRVENSGPCRRALHIEIPPEQVASEFDNVLTMYARAARIPGFRPGRAPRDIVKRRFGKEISKEVKERLIPRGYQQAVQAEKIETVAVLDVQDEPIEDGQPFTFKVTLDVIPSFDLPSYKAIPLQGQSRDVSEEEIDKALANMREQMAQYVDVAGRPVREGDLVQVDYEGVCDGQPIETAYPQATGLGKNTNFWVMADAHNEFLPGFAAGLIGAQVGEKRQILIDFPSKFPEAGLAGKKATYFTDVKALREKQLPAIDEAFLKVVGADTETALRERVRGDLAKLRENLERRRLQNEVAKYLLEKTQFEVPESVLQEEIKNEITDLVQANAYRGVSKDDLAQRKDELIEAATRNARDKIKLRYILRRIAREENVAVTGQEIDLRVHQMAERAGMKPERLRAELEKKEAMGRIEDEIRLAKTLARLVDQAEIRAA